MRLSRTLPYRKAAAWKPSTLPLCIFTGQRQLELREILGFHPTFSRHGIAQILSALALLIWLDEKVGVHPTFSRHGIAQSLSALASSFGLTKRLLQPAWWQGNLRRQSSDSPSPALYMMARCLPADGALSSAVCNVAHGRVQRCPRPCATLSMAVGNARSPFSPRISPLKPWRGVAKRRTTASRLPPSATSAYQKAGAG